MTTPIKFVDLDRMHAPIRPELDRAIARVIDGQDLILGTETARFEEEFAAYCGARHCIGVNSGTDALRLAVKALGIGPGDEVLVPANSFIATALTVSDNGGTPVFVDVDERTFNIDVAQAERLVTPRTKAIVPVHLYGQACDMDAIRHLAARHRLHVLEDACQAHGARFGGKPVPVMGLGCFSFYPSKNLGALGDGGAIVTDDDSLADELRALRNYGSPQKYFHPIRGYNSRLDSLQAAVLRVKLPHLPAWIESRRQCAARYRELLAGDPAVRLPYESPQGEHAYHVFAVRVPRRDALREHLSARGIITNIHYPTVIYRQGAYADLQGVNVCPVAEALSHELVSLPMFPFMTPGEIERVCREVRAFYAPAAEHRAQA